MTEQKTNGVAPLAALDNELRKRIYEFAREQGRPVTRDDVARKVGISRRLAAFHLDTLLEHGLLRAHYARPPGRSGPGAGRSSKMYEPSDIEIDVSIPERRYDLAGQLLVDAVQGSAPGESPHDAVLRVARDEGLNIGEDARRDTRLRRPGAERTLSVACDLLGRYGFEPVLDPGRAVTLRNCPFHRLAERAPGLVCGMNQAFVDGVLRGLGNDTVEAALTRRPSECCVTLRAPSA